ncbi:MAG: DUF3570 domain-containing protein [Halieaceae bacterium]
MPAKPRDTHPTLLALTSSALLLPAYQGARADAPPDFTEIGVSYSKYEEDDTQAGKTFGGSSERYEIDVAQFHLLAPVGDDWSVALDVQWEDMSGASPWFVGLSADGDPNVLMSGASIEDTRTSVSVTTRYYYDRGNTGLNFSYSDEDDYTSNAIALDTAFNSADGMTTYSAAISASSDDINPTQGATPTNTLDDNKDIRSAWIGVSRIISKRAILRFGLSYTYRDGFLTDPYKFNDSRPDERKEWALGGGYRQFFVGGNAALHADYRYFNDDWGIASHTVDLAWYQNIGSSTQLEPYFRYYNQGQADFFSNLVDFSEPYFADDYRLSAFGAITTGLRLRQELGDWTVNLTGERYTTSNDWSTYSGDESPGLVKYWRYSIGVDYAFR